MAQLTKSYLSKELIASWRDYLTLCKPKVVLLLLITAAVGMQLASPGLVSGSIMLVATVGIGLAACSAAVVNHIVDAQIDAHMKRTKRRPMVNGRISRYQASIFSLVLGCLAMWLLGVYVNVLTALLTLSGLIGYAFVYTMYLKHRTPQNIVFGGLAGALPPLLGWTSITNAIELEALLLVLIIFFWTPAHFWPLAIDRLEDYKKANVPMLPVTHGVEYTKTCIIWYSLALCLVSLLPYFYGMSGLWYLSCAILLDVWFLYHALKLKFSPINSSAMTTFYVSIFYLFALFIALLADHALSYGI